MQNRLSKILREHLEASRNDARSSGDASLMADNTFIYMMRGDMSHASHILSKLLKDWELYQLKIRIEREVAKVVERRPSAMSENGSDPADQMFSEIVDQINDVHLAASARFSKQSSEHKVLNSGYFLSWLLGRQDTISSRVLELYGVTLSSVEEYLMLLPQDEEYYSDIEALNRLSREFPDSSPYPVLDVDEQEQTEEEFRYNPNRDNPAVGGKFSSRPSIERYGTNLSKSAQRGEIDPVVGRDREIERAMQILGRRKKNNPILIGEAGVGKSAIVEGLALRIETGDVPVALQGKEIFSLDVAALVAGTKFRGEFEQRIKELLDQMTQMGNMILFIDEVHTIVGTGGAQGGLDTANILKPALARGTLQCIGATTMDEYRINIETDSALERRFQRVVVEATTKEQTLQILRNVKQNYEQHHCVQYTDDALRACVELTGRYVTERNFPDKAIDAMDEAGSKARSLDIRKPASLKRLETELANIRKRQKESLSHEDDVLKKMHVRIAALQSKLEQAQVEWKEQLYTNPVEVAVEHIEEVITTMTGVPVERISQGEKRRLSGMREYLESRVIGQANAAEKVTKSIQRSRTGLKDPNKPIGVFMFVGPTGMGKTHLAKELSQLMFDGRDSLIRIDMSEYSEKHNVSRMIGSPPGYVGYSEGGQLTEAVRRQPYSVVLFDEIEKAHRDVYNIMLQIFDEGQLTDGLGRRVDFRNTIIIMTSNVGSREVVNKRSAVGYLTETTGVSKVRLREAEYRNSLTKTFAPEFINRIDDIVVFNTLSVEDVHRIVELELKSLIERTKLLGYKLKVTARAKRQLAQMGYDPKYGIRSLKRVILDSVEAPLAELIVDSEVEQNDTIGVDHHKDTIRITRTPAT